MANIQFQLRRGIASEWTSANPILAAGEVGVETDTNKIKIGNGNSGWTSLSYAIGGASGASGITGPYVTTFNGLTGTVGLSAGIGINIATSGNTLTLFATTGITFTQTGTGFVSRTIDSIFKDTLSVKDFGAVGNGIANDTTAIQNALNAGASGCVYFPQGTYKITAGLTVSANTTLRADIRKAVIDVQPANAPVAPGVTGPLTYNNGFVINGDGVIFNGLWIKGSNEAKYRNEPGLPPLAGATGIQWRRDEYAAAIRSTNKQNIVIQNCTIEKFANGVFFTGGNNYKIIDNFFFGGRQMGAANQIANAHDIFMNGSGGASVQKGFRGIISRNHCLGNGDDAITVAIEGGDTDVVISENVIEPFQTDGITPVTNLAPDFAGYPSVDPVIIKVNPLDPVLQNESCNKTRYAIIVSYNGGWPSRIVVSNNIIRNNAHNGIYANSSILVPPAAGSEVVITGNIVSNCGYGLLYPSDTSLKGGIWINSNGGKTVSGNLVIDCTTAGINVIGPNDDTGNTFATPVITGNSILRTVLEPIKSNAGHGIAITGQTVHSVLVSSNRIYNSAGNAILTDCTGISSGNIQLNDNMISHGNSGNTGSAISITLAAGAADCFVANNKITGQTNGISNGGKNAGIWINGRVHCVGNSITNFHRGIESNFTGVRTTDVLCSNNTIKDTFYAITGQGTGPWLVSGNVFKNITNAICHAGPFQGTMVRETGKTSSQPDIIHITSDAIPTTGIWIKGDYIKNSNSIFGQPKGYYCTVSGTGTAATWVSEGDLTSSSVYSIRGLTGTVGLSAGSDINITQSGNTLTISSTVLGACAGVQALNGITGTVGLSAGTGITIVPSGNTLIITSIGAVTGVTVGGTNVFTALNTFNAGISASGITLNGYLTGSTGFLFGPTSAFLQFIPRTSATNGGIWVKNGLFQVGGNALGSGLGTVDFSPNSERFHVFGYMDVTNSYEYQKDRAVFRIAGGATQAAPILAAYKQTTEGDQLTTGFTTTNMVAGIDKDGALFSIVGISAAGATFSKTVNLNSNTLYKPTLQYYNEPVSSPSISGNTLSLDLSLAQVFNVSLNAGISAFIITNVPQTASRAIGFSLFLTADGTARGISWGSAVKWPSNISPTLTTTNNKTDILSFTTLDGGTSYFGSVAGQNY